HVCTLTSLCAFLLRRSFLHRHVTHRALHSFPTRRSSDLWFINFWCNLFHCCKGGRNLFDDAGFPDNLIGFSSLVKPQSRSDQFQDRKSTRLNSSHVKISYAVFCLKKKNKKVTDMYIVYIR